MEASVKKTGRCVVVHEATRTSGFGAELSALVQERCFYHLEAPVERVTGFDTPYPHSLEWAYFPGPDPHRRSDRQGWGPERGHVSYSSCPTSAKASPKPRSSRGTSRSATHVEEDGRLADMMTDKATVEMESPVAGTIVEVAGEAGDVVAIGSPLVVIETEGERQGSAGAEAPSVEKRIKAETPEAPDEARAVEAGEPAPDAATPEPVRPELVEAPSPAPRFDKLGHVSEALVARSSPRPPSARGQRNWASTSPKCRAAEGGRIRHSDLDAFLSYGGRQGLRAGRRKRCATRRSRSSACAAGSPRTWPLRSATFRTSPTSRNATSPTSRSCARDLNANRGAKPQAHTAAAADHRDLPRAARVPDDQRALRRRGQRGQPLGRGPPRRRDDDRRRADGPGDPRRARQEPVAAARARLPASPRRPAAAARSRRNCPARR